MLLRHTGSEVKERKALTVNPAKTCQPIGAMYAALGIHKCLPHSHGSQGCCAYHRSQLTRHYKEPVFAATSSFTEGSSVFGGQSNLVQAIDTIFSTYEPDVIAVHTTCLSETIGDDMVQIITKAQDDGKIPEGKCVIHGNTPSYQGSHVTGYANMVRGMVDYFADGDGTGTSLNLIPGWLEPADMREIKRLAGFFGIDYTLFPDTSDVLDAGMLENPGMYPSGGVTVAQIAAAGMAKRTLALGATGAGPAARHLEGKCKVTCDVMEAPFGLAATDRFISALIEFTGGSVPETVSYERQRLVDLMCDMQQYFYGKRVALWGDPDQLVPLTEFLVDLGMQPCCVVTGTPGKEVSKRLAAVLERVPGAKFKVGIGADMYLMHQWIKEQSVDLLIGGTHGKYIARDENIPLVRHGFPVLDRIGHQYFPTVGYAGAIRLCEQILNAFHDQFDRECPEEKFELVM